jgi:TRAP-type C4-dicarboxylate transport system substrate-binding protein
MGYGEVFTAIQTGVVDGAENNPPTLLTANHYQAGAKFYTQTHHLIIPEILVMSKAAWDKLSPADQALFRKAGREAQMEQRALWDSYTVDAVAKLKAAGVEFIEMDSKPFYDATAPVRAKYGAPYAELMKRIDAVK